MHAPPSTPPPPGKLLKIYGRYLEWVRNEPSTAQKYYLEAMKQGMGESLLALVSGSAASTAEQEGTLKVCVCVWGGGGGV